MGIIGARTPFNQFASRVQYLQHASEAIHSMPFLFLPFLGTLVSHETVPVSLPLTMAQHNLHSST